MPRLSAPERDQRRLKRLQKQKLIIDAKVNLLLAAQRAVELQIATLEQTLNQ